MLTKNSSENYVVPDENNHEVEPLNTRSVPGEINRPKSTCCEALLGYVKLQYRNALYVKSNITVEPVIACFIIPSMIASLATQNLNLDKACRVNMKYSDEVCDALKIRNITNYGRQEMEVQKLIASIQVWKNIIQTSLPMIIIVFIGAWSDRTGKRKLCILMPIVGEFLVCISNLMNTYFFYEIPVQVTMLLEGLFPAVTGGWTTLLLGVFSYISDVTTTEARTFRVGLVNLCLTAGLPVGSALSGVLVKRLGFYGVFSLSACLYTFNFFYTLFVLKERPKPASKENCGAVSFFDLSNLKETIKIVFKKRDNNRRMKIIMVLMIAAIVYGPNHGESTVMYYYARFRFGWDAVQFSVYSTFSIIMHSLGALFSISVFSRRLRWDDSVLGLISICSKFFGSVVKSQAVNDMQIYLVPLVEILNATTFTSLRSIASKLVPSEEMGKINSMLSLVETFAAMCYDPLYSWMYMVSLPDNPGTAFLFSAAMTIPSASIFLWLFLQHRRTASKTAREKDEFKEAGEVCLQTPIEDLKTIDQTL